MGLDGLKPVVPAAYPNRPLLARSHPGSVLVCAPGLRAENPQVARVVYGLIAYAELEPATRTTRQTFRRGQILQAVRADRVARLRRGEPRSQPQPVGLIHACGCLRVERISEIEP